MARHMSCTSSRRFLPPSTAQVQGSQGFDAQAVGNALYGLRTLSLRPPRESPPISSLVTALILKVTGGAALGTETLQNACHTPRKQDPNHPTHASKRRTNWARKKKK